MATQEDKKGVRLSNDDNTANLTSETPEEAFWKEQGAEMIQAHFRRLLAAKAVERKKQDQLAAEEPPPVESPQIQQVRQWSAKEVKKQNRSMFLSTLEPVVAPIMPVRQMVRSSITLAPNLFSCQGEGMLDILEAAERETEVETVEKSMSMSEDVRKKRAIVRRSVEISGAEHMVHMGFKQGATKFNIKPKDGIKFLVEKGLIEDDPKSISEYLHAHSEVLSKRRLGEYIGGIKEENQAILTHYLEGLDFAGLSLDEALRTMLREFRLPGEAQVIDRILEKFSQAYFIARGEACGLKDSDAVFVFAFSIIMLNTDLHNPSVEKKLTLDQWKNNNRGINGGDHISHEVQEDVYNKIKQNEIRMQEGDQWEGEVVTFMAPKKSGWLFKMNHGGIQRWSKHWFVLSEHVLYYLNKPNDEHPRLILPMDNIRVGRSRSDPQVIDFVSADGGKIKCTKKLKEGSMQLQTYTDFTLKAPSPEEREEWFDALTQEINQDPVLRLQRLKSIAAKESYKASNEIDKQLKSTRAMKSVFIKPSTKKDSKGKSKLIGRGPLDLPAPSAEGWMKKRGENNLNWKKRYFAIIDPEEALCLGTALYYFESKDALQRMLELGEQTQKGQVFFSAIKKTSMAFDKSDKAANIELLCEDRTWILRPDDAESFTFWLGEFDRFKSKQEKETQF